MELHSLEVDSDWEVWSCFLIYFHRKLSCIPSIFDIFKKGSYTSNYAYEFKWGQKGKRLIRSLLFGSYEVLPENFRSELLMR